MGFTKCRTMSKRLKSGGLATAHKQVKRRRDIAGQYHNIRVAATSRTKINRTRGGNFKVRVLQASDINMFDPVTHVFSQEKIISVVENQADRNYVQRNILSKGTIVKTARGNAKITSRPGQHGVLNAIKV